MCHKLRSLKHWNTPELEIQNKTSIITLMREVRLTSLNNEPHDKTMEAVMDTNEHMILEELWYKTEETYITCLLYTSKLRS